MSLRDLGLSPSQEALYRVLLAEPVLGFDELVQRTGSDPSGVRTDLDRLGELALTFPDAGAACGAVARRPGVALGRLAERRTLELSRHLREIADTHAEIVALDELALGRGGLGAHAGGESLEGVTGFEVLRGRAAISQRLDELAYGSRETTDSMVPGPPRPKDVVDTGASARRSVNQGLRVRWLIEQQLLDGDVNSKQVREAVQAGALVRVGDRLPMRLIIADGTFAVVPIDVTDRNVGALVIAHAPLVSALQALFDQHWRRAKPLAVIGGELVVSPERTAVDEQAVLRALAVGSTDDAAARTAGISDRQFRRRLNSAMTALGARNRFQAGVLAERQGLLVDPSC